jgi:hypothetical protein
MLRRFCKERELHIDYKRRARTGSSCLLLETDVWENEHAAKGWEMLPGGFHLALHLIPRLEPTSTIVELIRFECSFCHNE